MSCCDQWYQQIIKTGVWKFFVYGPIYFVAVCFLLGGAFRACDELGIAPDNYQQRTEVLDKK